MNSIDFEAPEPKILSNSEKLLICEIGLLRLFTASAFSLVALQHRMLDSDNLILPFLQYTLSSKEHSQPIAGAFVILPTIVPACPTTYNVFTCSLSLLNRRELFFQHFR